MSAIRCVLCRRLVAGCLTPRNFSGATRGVLQISQLHSSAVATAGEKWRLRHGMSRSGTEYGPLTDLQDWSYVDGTKAPVSKRQKKRNQTQRAINSRIRRLMKEVDRAAAKGEPLETGTNPDSEDSKTQSSHTRLIRNQ